jgi:hypothetical protein
MGIFKWITRVLTVHIRDSRSGYTPTNTDCSNAGPGAGVGARSSNHRTIITMNAPLILKVREIIFFSPDLCTVVWCTVVWCTVLWCTVRYVMNRFLTYRSVMYRYVSLPEEHWLIKVNNSISFPHNFLHLVLTFLSVSAVTLLSTEMPRGGIPLPTIFFYRVVQKIYLILHGTVCVVMKIKNIHECVFLKTNRPGIPEVPLKRK